MEFAIQIFKWRAIWAQVSSYLENSKRFMLPAFANNNLHTIEAKMKTSLLK